MFMTTYTSEQIKALEIVRDLLAKTPSENRNEILHEWNLRFCPLCGQDKCWCHLEGTDDI